MPEPLLSAHLQPPPELSAGEEEEATHLKHALFHHHSWLAQSHTTYPLSEDDMHEPEDLSTGIMDWW